MNNATSEVGTRPDGVEGSVGIVYASSPLSGLPGRSDAASPDGAAERRLMPTFRTLGTVGSNGSYGW